jgi:thiol-disulfide isomerase/thioredoxin
MVSNKLRLILYFLIINCNAAIDIQTEKQFNQILKNKKLIIASFHAENWCPDSKRYKGIFQKLEEKNSKIATFIKINKDNLQSLLTKYYVKSVPTTAIFNHTKLLFITNSTDTLYIENKLIDSLKNIK